MYTIGQIIVFIVLGILALFCTFGIGYIRYDYENSITAGFVGGFITFILSAIILGGMMAYTAWHNTSTASGIRHMKDYKSELANGIEREIVITSEDGREIFRYEGKVDIESDHTDNYIKFESEEGKRYIIYYGIADTVTIIEK